MTNRAAFFDLDKTLVPGSSLFLLARGLYDRDMTRVRDIVRFAFGQASFVLFGSERERGMKSSREAALEFVKGRSQEELRALGREISEERILPRVYPDIAAVIAGHNQAGTHTYLVTATPVEVAEVVAAGLDMTGALGTISELDEDGRYTGALIGDILHGPAKSKAVAELAGRMGFDLRECAAYSDSINDLPLLESVGHPHAVNPDRALARTARSRGWPIHELRTRRRALLIGIPSALGGATLFASGIAVGSWLAQRRQRRASRFKVP
jgi:HAD superfamily hydrolase (TIGR01490 family)